MAVRTKRIAAYSGSTITGGTVVFICPAGRTAIVKDVTLINASGATATMTLSLRTGGVAFGLHRGELADGSRISLTGRHIVLEPGDELRLAVGAGNSNGSVVAFGTLLAGEPT